MRLRILMCFMGCLLPVYGDGDVGEERLVQKESGQGDFEENDASSPGAPLESSPASSSSISESHKKVNIWGNFGLVSDYLHNGQTQTFGGPAAQGEFVIGQKKGEGFYVGAWGSNISDTIAANGAGLELDLSVGYAYKYNSDLSLKLEVINARYPGAYASLPTKDTFNTVEIIPSVTYKIFSFLFGYYVTDASGVNQNFAPIFYVPLQPNGNSRGSWHSEVNVLLPVSFINDRLKFSGTWGYSYFKNYTKLNYTNWGIGLNYELPETWGGLILSVNGSTTSANKKYYTVLNSAGRSKNTAASKIWVGVIKEF